jgi:hypothetical protein
MVWKKKKTGLGRKRQTRASLKARESNREQRAHKNKASDGPDSSTLEVALQYASIGLPVFPLHAKSFAGKCSCNRKCSEPGKHPRVKKATTIASSSRSIGPSGQTPRSACRSVQAPGFLLWW